MREYTLEQMKENRGLWVEALRSGKYKQGQRRLRTWDEHFCCLGVLSDVAGCTWTKDVSRGYLADGFAVGHANDEAMAFVGLKGETGAYLGDDYRSLTDANDGGVTFAEIADLIESNPDGLFIDPSPSPARSA